MKFIISIFMILIFVSCGSRNKKEPESQKVLINMDTLLEMNRNMIRKDKDKIHEYIASNGTTMLESGTGLFYRKILEVDGVDAGKGDVVIFSYDITSLQGNKFYSSKDLGRKEFEIDGSVIESGWNEVATLMSAGDSMIAILPPHLAFRNIGDGEKIGPGQILIYNLRLDSIVRR